MFEAFRVGPVDTHEGTFTLYAACSPDGTLSAIATDDAAGLAELRKRAPGGVVSCEPALANAGRPLGFRPAALSDDAKHARAVFAMMLALGKTVEPRAINRLQQLVEVGQRFMRERPWEIVRPEVPVEIVIELDGRERRYAASILGADGIEFGIALHESADALARFVDLALDDRHEEMRAMPVRSVAVSSEPAWVADAVQAAFGDRIVIVPTACGAAGPRPVTCEDLSELAVAMFAVTKLGPARLAAEVTIEVDEGVVCRAKAQITQRDAVTAPPLPEWAQRPMLVTGDVPAALLVVPVLPVPDLAAASAGLRAIGFEIVETTERTATATWPGVVIELVHAPSTRGIGCHVVVESIDALATIWEAAGIPFRVIESGAERILFLELPGGLNLTFGQQLPMRHAVPRTPAKPRRRKPRAH